MKLTLRLAHGLVAAVFLLMAALQLNDPDPLYWVVVYTAVAAIPAARAFGQRLPTILLIACGMVLAGLLFSLPGFIDYLTSGDYASLGGAMMAEKPYVEPAREFLGLLIAAGCLMAYGRAKRA